MGIAMLVMLFGILPVVLSGLDYAAKYEYRAEHGVIISVLLLTSLSFFWCIFCEPGPTEKVDKKSTRNQVDKKKPLKLEDFIDKLHECPLQRVLQTTKAEITWYSTAYDAQKELLKQRAIDMRDKERIIQNQAIEVARFDHRAEAAKYRLKAKNEYIDGLQKEIEVKRITIQDRDSTIRSQAQQVMNAQWDVEAMKKQIREKDDQHWKLSGQNTIAQQEITKLKAAVANEYTTSDYCCALHTIDRRDQTISALQNQLKQYRDAHEFDRKSYESLIATARVHNGTPDAEFVSIVKAWVRNVISKRTQPDHEPSSTASNQDGCDPHRHIINLQHRLLYKTLQERVHLEKMVVGQKTQITELEKIKDSEGSRIQAQLTGEKQHLLDALSKAQHNANDVTNAYQAAEKERKAAKQQLKEARALVKTHEAAMDISKTERDQLQADLAHMYQNSQNAARETQQLEDAIAQGQQELFQTRVKLQIVEHGLNIAGVECDVWRLREASELADKLENIKAAASEQEAKLAESCAELNASNEELKTKLSEQEAAKKEISAQLAAANEKRHKQHVEWQQSLLQAHNALRAAKLESPNLEFKNKINSLETKLDLSMEEEKSLRKAHFDEELRSRELAAQVTDWIGRERRARDCLNNALALNKGLRNKIAGHAERIEEFKAQLDTAEEVKKSCRAEIQRLNGLLDAREDDIAELEQAREGLEKKLLLGDEFVEVEEADVPLLAEQAGGEEDNVVTVQDEDVEDFEIEFEEVEVDEDGDGIENENGMPAVRVQ